MSRVNLDRVSDQTTFEKIKRPTPSGEDWVRVPSKKKNKKRIEKRREYK